MPRDLPLGNGSLLINFDTTYTLRDIYYPHVGQENQTDGHINHVGIWVAGQFSWLSDPGWERSMRYESETLVTDVTMRHAALGITLHWSDAVDFDRDIFLRRVEVTNTGEVAREVRLFFHYDWHIEESDGGNTVYYAPDTTAVIAYRNARYFLASGSAGDHWGIDSWATGYKEFNGYQGTWRDAEDGELGRNPIAQGDVDATIALHLGMVAASATATGYHWLVAGTDYRHVRATQRLIQDRGAASFIDRTRNYWRLWVNKSVEPMEPLTPAMIDLYKRSLLMVATQMDSDGAIIAATDGDVWTFNRDSYAYMWPRDGALVANALSHSGYGEPTREFFRFCARVITDAGYLLHKYTPAGALGSSWHPWSNEAGQPQLPIQEDETALVVYSLWQQYAIFKDVEFIKPLYAPLIKAAANFMVQYRDPTTKLPGPSYDLWEERHGIHAYTVAAVYAGLQAAANFAECFGEDSVATQYRAAATEIQEATRRYLWDEQDGRFLRRITVDDHGQITPDRVMDMAITALYQFGMFPADDPQMTRTMDALMARLQIKTSVGGYARYENDYYHQVSHDIDNVPGNPWFICSCWAAQYHIARAQTDDELHAALPMLQWVVDHALASGVLAEQVDPNSDAPLSVSPLTWSHAEYISTVRWLVGKHRRLMASSLGAEHPATVALRDAPGEPRRDA